jgi:hypothetical protein
MNVGELRKALKDRKRFPDDLPVFIRLTDDCEVCGEPIELQDKMRAIGVVTDWEEKPVYMLMSDGTVD